MSRKHGKNDRTKDWERVAKIFESDAGLEVMENSRALSAIERRQLLGAGATKLVSVRIPEDDLEALKAIAESHDRKYQQLLVQAIERFLNEYYENAKVRKKA